MMNTTPIRALAGLSLCLALGACQTLPERVADKEDLLAAAGFDVRAANTAARSTSLKTLPANRVVTEQHAGVYTYVYADPVVCHCLYVGDQKAYDAYRNEMGERELLSEQELANQMAEDDWNWDGWDWDGWGGRFGGSLM